MTATMNTVRDLAAKGSITIGGDACLSMGGALVSAADVISALVYATSCEDRGGFLVVSGPSLDGEALLVICQIIGDYVSVRDVVRP